VAAVAGAFFGALIFGQVADVCDVALAIDEPLGKGTITEVEFVVSHIRFSDCCMLNAVKRVWFAVEIAGFPAKTSENASSPLENCGAKSKNAPQIQMKGTNNVAL
jgi:hypothetical protein